MLPARFTAERQPVLRPAVAFSKINFKHRSVQIKGNFTKLTLIYTLNVSCIMLVYYFVRLLSLIVTFYSEFQTVITP